MHFYILVNEIIKYLLIFYMLYDTSDIIEYVLW